jgi:hypothetical protein
MGRPLNVNPVHDIRDSLCFAIFPDSSDLPLGLSLRHGLELAPIGQVRLPELVSRSVL